MFVRFFLILLISTVSAQLIGATYSFEDLEKKAIRENFGIKEEKNTIESAGWEKMIATRNFFLPKFNLTTSVSDQNIYDGPFESRSEENSNGKPLFKSVLSAKYNLFNGLFDYHDLKEKSVDFLYARMSLRIKIENVVYELKYKYLELSDEMNNLNIIRDELDKSLKLFNASKIKFKRGRIAKSDLKRSELQYLQAKNDKATQVGLIERLKLDLQKIINAKGKLVGDIRPYKYLTLDANLGRLLGVVAASGIEGATDRFYTLFLRYGSGLKLLQLNYKKSVARKGQMEAGWFPTVTVEGSHNYLKQEGRYAGEIEKRDYYVLSLNLTIPIFDSFDVMIRNKQAKLNVINARHSENREKVTTYNEIQGLCLDLKTKYDTYKIVKKKLELRKFVYNSTFRRFQRGAVTVQDLIDDKLLLQRENFYLAKISSQLLKLALRLDKITGQLVKKGDIES